jgi:hypothetical protein
MTPVVSPPRSPRPLHPVAREVEALLERQTRVAIPLEELPGLLAGEGHWPERPLDEILLGLRHAGERFHLIRPPRRRWVGPMGEGWILLAPAGGVPDPGPADPSRARVAPHHGPPRGSDLGAIADPMEALPLGGGSPPSHPHPAPQAGTGGACPSPTSGNPSPAIGFRKARATHPSSSPAPVD